jgi:antitoxin FitA
MPAITIRNLSVETHRALKVRAARHGRSTEAEVRDILEQAARPEERVSSARSWPISGAKI